MGLDREVLHAGVIREHEGHGGPQAPLPTLLIEDVRDGGGAGRLAREGRVDREAAGPARRQSSSRSKGGAAATPASPYAAHFQRRSRLGTAWRGRSVRSQAGPPAQRRRGQRHAPGFHDRRCRSCGRGVDWRTRSTVVASARSVTGHCTGCGAPVRCDRRRDTVVSQCARA